MDIRRINSDDGVPVPLDELKEDLRVDDDDFDGTLKRMGATAAAMIQKRTGYILVPGEFEAVPRCFESWSIVASPFRELVSVEAMTGKNDWTALDVDDFQVIDRGREFVVCAWPTFVEPTLYTPQASIRLRFRAGFDVAPSDQSEAMSSGDGDYPLDPLVRGVYIALVGHLYENRELFEADKMTEIESSAGGLLNSIRYFF